MSGETTTQIQSNSQKDYAFFLGCIMPNRYPQIEKATKYVMSKLGYNLHEMEKASCCPAPGVLRSFDKFDWMVAGARNISIAEKKNMDLLTVCNGCFGTLKDINVHLKEDVKAREQVNNKLKSLGDYEFKGNIRVRHIAELLTMDIGPVKITKYLTRKLHAKVAIHYGCHFLKPTSIRQVDSSEKPHILEDYVIALGLTPLSFTNQHTCCGAGGGLKSGYSDASMTLFAEKMRNIDEVKPDFILDVCPFCHLQFESGQDYLNKNQGTHYDYPVIHLSQLTAFCMGMDPKFVGLQYQMMGKKYMFNEEEKAVE